MTEHLTVGHVGRRGEGVVLHPAGPLYVPYTLPGERIEVETCHGEADRRRLVRVEAASADRIAPICPHFGSCGGCALQHWAAPAYRRWKRSLVETALLQAGLAAPVDDVVDAQGEGRRRIVLHARRTADGRLQVGFAAARAHEVVAVEQCPILTPALGGALATARAVAEQLGTVQKPLDIQVTATESGLDIDVRGSGPLPSSRMATLARVAEQHRLARLTRHGELVVQRAAPVVRIGRAQVTLPPGAFLQATVAGEAALAELAEKHCGGAKIVADLFAGVGPFALRLAERGPVTAVDSNAGAIAALRRAAETTPKLKPVKAEVRDLFRRPLLAQELKPFAAVVFDPPRQGAQAQARELARSSVPVIVAVSCHPGSFARDARILVDGGYRLTRVTPIDQFLYSPHVELVGCFER